MHQTRAITPVLCLVLAVAACLPPPTPSDSVLPSGSLEPSASELVSPSSVTAVPSGQGGPSLPADSWRSITPEGTTPTARLGHSWTVDPSAAESAYLFGGTGPAGPVAELWTYDLGADRWSQVPSDAGGPPARHGHAAGWLDGVGLLIVGGIGADGRPLDDAWIFDPTLGRWTASDTGAGGPSPRAGACAAVDPAGMFWLTHGRGAEDIDDTWRYDPAAATWLAATPGGELPSARSGAACWWTPSQGLALAGGSTDVTAAGDGWVLDEPGTSSAEWTRLPVDLSEAARSRAAVVRSGDSVVMFGGLDGDGAVVGDVVVIDLETLGTGVFATPAGGPSPRTDAAMVDDPASERVLVFGGTTTGDAAGATAELWQLDPP